LGEGEGEQEPEPKRSRRAEASDIRSGPKEDGSRAEGTMGQSEGEKEGGVDHWGMDFKRSGLYAFRTKEKAHPRRESGLTFLDAESFRALSAPPLT
jgi:hypothetical protein